jgi:soluble lytic murein transglycosylase
MTMSRYSVLSIPGLWFSPAALTSLYRAARPLALGALCATLVFAAAAPGPAALARACRETPSPAHRAQLERYAAAHPKDNDGALARLALGIAAYEQKDYDAAISSLSAAGRRLPKLADYVAYYLAAARIEAKDATVNARDLDAVRSVSSPLASPAAVLEARALIAANRAAEAVRVLRERPKDIPHPDGDLALAMACEASGEPVQAAAAYQFVYYGYPLSDAAGKAAEAIARLRDGMGRNYPPPSTALVFARADKLLAAGDSRRAGAEYRALVAQVDGFARDQARVRAAAADYMAGNVAAASRALRTLSLSRSEADAERLYHIAQCARKMDDDDGMMLAVQLLAEAYPQSAWRFKALVSAANRFLVDNRPERYLPLYQAAYENFPAESLAPVCHWKVAWNSYLNHKDDAAARLRRQVEQFPRHTSATAALYFLGRLSEKAGASGEARAYYAKLAERFPNYYYGLLARGRLGAGRLADAAPDGKTAAYLNGIALPPKPRGTGLVPEGATTVRIERARLLRGAGLDDLAATELRFGARAGEQPPLLAVELARGGETAFQKLRLMKSMGIDYFALLLAEAPGTYWESLFPLPYRNELVRNAKLNGLDPFTVAALVRQESEFNPQAVSRAKAYGLTQVMPATGRLLARRAGLRRFSPRMLFQPEVNLKLGTYYIRSLLDKWGGRWEETLAAYNAGPNRAAEWAAWRSYEEPAEFVETVPYTETREYIQAVLRNAAMYRLIYQDRPMQVAAAKAPSKTVEPAAKSSGGSVQSARKPRRGRRG